MHLLKQGILSEGFIPIENVLLCNQAGDFLMSQVYEIIKRAGRIPLDELVLRTSQGFEVVADELRALENEKLISIEGGIPDAAELPTRAAGTIIMLTHRGFSALAL